MTVKYEILDRWFVSSSFNDKYQDSVCYNITSVLWCRDRKMRKCKSNGNTGDTNQAPSGNNTLFASVSKSARLRTGKVEKFRLRFFFGKSVLRQMVKERAQSNSRPLTGNFHSELNQNVIQHRLFIVIHPYDALRFPIVHIVLLANALGTVPHFHPEWITKSFWLFGENTLWSACTILSQPATNEL